ncbi:unnamed protein product [Penicillium crustosum]
MYLYKALGLVLTHLTLSRKHFNQHLHQTPPTLLTTSSNKQKQQLAQQEDVALLMPASLPRNAQRRPLSRPRQQPSQPVSQHPPAREYTHPVSSATRTTNAARVTVLLVNVDRRMIIGQPVVRIMGPALLMNTAAMGIPA